jgi:eukaryotic-like serine/threonine-protein kinase
MESPSIDRVFWDAAQIASPGEREAYLDRACAGDGELRRKVEQLLQARPKAESFLESPAANLVARAGEPPVPERPGTVIGPYKLLQQIGEGGMGTVFLAEQTHPVQRKVALKVIKAGMDSQQVIARFEAERQALALMDHVNIARVLDAGATESGRPFFVMELVHGVPITQYCDDNRLTPRQRLELFVPVCQAIQHAHHKGIIHRDVKPSNVMITLYDGKPVPKVIDFGVAKATEQRLTERTLFTQYGTMVGTPEYMSPEQAERSALGADTRSDIFSLGVLLYELLTGGTPLSHERLKEAAFGEVLRMIREEEPPRPSTRLSDSGEALASISARRHMEPATLTRLVRGELDWIVMKCLEKDRNRRYETAGAFAADVQRYLHDEPVLAFPPSPWYRLWKIARRHKGLGLAASLVVLALVGGIVGTTWGLLRATDARADAVNAAAQKEDALKDAKAALAAARQSERGADQRLFESYLAQARAHRLSRRAGQRFESLDVLQRATQLARALDLPAERFHELRNSAIATLALPDLDLAGPWNPYPADTYGFDFDEAHAIYARTDRQGSCSIRRVADDTETHRLPGPGGPAVPCLSRDGRFVAVYQQKVRLDLWKLDEGPARRILSEKSVQFVDFHRDGQQVALAYNDGAIGLFELPGGRQLSRLAPDTAAREVVIALHPTEPLLAVCSYFSLVVQLRDVRTGKVVASLPQSTRVSAVAWHPDGRTLAVGYAESHQIRLYDRTTGQAYRTLETEQPVTSMDFDHAGDRLAITGWVGFLELFDVGPGQKLMGTPPVLAAHRFSRDDRRLAGGVQDGKLGIWQVGDGREYRRLIRKALPEKDEYSSVAVSLDGRLLAAAMTDGFGLWDLGSGSELAFIPSGDRDNSVLFEPSGALLTLSTTGLSRWPAAKELNAAGELSIGPSEPLPLPRGHDLGQSRDGRVIVTCDRAAGAQQVYAGGWILHADRPKQPIRLDAGADIAWITVSPDGRWVVTVTLSPRVAKVWDARDGRLVKRLADWGTGPPRFSPDGRWLATGPDGGRLFAVETWEPGPRVGGRGVFAPDSKLMAVEVSTGVIRLLDPAPGRELATLEDPNLDWTYLPVFTPDGTRLISSSNGKVKGIHVWDLRLLRQHLAEMGLDWEAPPYPPADPGSKTAQPLKVKLLLGDPATPALAPEQKARQALDNYRRAVAMNPGRADTCNNLAWAYLTAPEALRDVKAALPLAEKASRLAPENAVYRNTLGVAYYRDGRFREAVETLRPNLEHQEDRLLAFDLYFLAMSHHRLGEAARARDYYDCAVRWSRMQRDLSAGHLEELTVFQAEAEELLKQESGTKNQAPEKKKSQPEP